MNMKSYIDFIFIVRWYTDDENFLVFSGKWPIRPYIIISSQIVFEIKKNKRNTFPKVTKFNKTPPIPLKIPFVNCQPDVISL